MINTQEETWITDVDVSNAIHHGHSSSSEIAECLNIVLNDEFGTPYELRKTKTDLVAALAKLAQLEAALNDEDFMGLRYEVCEIADTGDHDTIWITEGYRYGNEKIIPIGYGHTPIEALIDSMKHPNDETKWDYCPESGEDAKEVRGE